MNTLLTLAQYTSTESTLTTEEAIALAGALFVFWVFVLFFSLIGYVVSAIFLSKIFTKAGVPGWVAWVPVYNTWKTLEIGGQQGFWSILAFIPIVNIVSAVFVYIAMHHIGKKLGKDGAFVVLGIFLPLVWLIWLAVDKSKWNDKASTAPSLHKAA